ncbi:hypothetical protein [Hymenobacter metallilatus]|uniref:Lipocalin-like domain-containing protein n=1 Tax=Hymenobacter metallilatus TaxID=2493666 RepID=A0A428JRZ7_9BACT|nr:hypothetical protein [Hymenobacter metallilatus]RSK36321.1 hypothetical protein EI290_05415 [Hymenobacter metallilatus]
MRIKRPLILFAVFFSTFFMVGSCDNTSCGCDPVPVPSVVMAQMAQKWRLDEVYLNNQLAGSGSTIKDRYTIQLRADGTYVQTLLADGTTYNGTWKLEESNMLLNLVDHKGAAQDYTVGRVSNQELRYAWVNKSGETEERRFTSVL